MKSSYDTDACSPGGLEKARLNNTHRQSGVWSGVRRPASSPPASADAPLEEAVPAIAAPSARAAAEGTAPVGHTSPAHGRGRAAQSAHDQARFVAAESEAGRLAAAAVKAERDRRKAQSAADLHRADLAHAARLRAVKTAEVTAAAEATLLAAVLDDEANGRFVEDEALSAEGTVTDTDISADDEADSGDDTSIDDEQDGGFVANEGNGASAEDEETVSADAAGNLFTGSAFEGPSPEGLADNWVAAGEVPVIPDVASTRKVSDGTLMYAHPRATCLRLLPEYPGASRTFESDNILGSRSIILCGRPTMTRPGHVASSPFTEFDTRTRNWMGDGSTTSTPTSLTNARSA